VDCGSSESYRLAVVRIVGAALLSAAAGCWIGCVTVVTASPANWSDGGVLGLIAAGGLCLVAAVAVLGWPSVSKAREERAKVAFERRARFRNALQELADELIQNLRDLRIQLANGRTYGIRHPGSAWSKHRHVLNAPKLATTRELVQDAYMRTHALNQQTNERYDAASHEDVSDPEWLRLTDEEVREREEAEKAVDQARKAVLALKDAHPL
jgi:hypothetical protein